MEPDIINPNWAKIDIGSKTHFVSVGQALEDVKRRVVYKKGRAIPVSATARKLAVILWNMLTKKNPYGRPMEYLFLDKKRKLRLVSKNKKSIAKFELKPEDLGFADALLSASL